MSAYTAMSQAWLMTAFISPSYQAICIGMATLWLAVSIAYRKSA